MKANVLGSVAGFGLYFIRANNLVLILPGIIVVISLGFNYYDKMKKPISR
jgi:hypothetical protein